MSGVISKRQQARNEKQLQELVQTITGNNICADCYARNPAWASWSNMRKVGNVASNRIYNPDNKKAPVPVDADEADSAMERFIRQKYMHNVAAQTSKPRSPISDEGTPPPPPPKNSKFGFRAAFSRSKNVLDKSPNGYAPASPPLINKPSKVFGATVDYEAPDDTEKKLAKLRDMGFQNDQRNLIVLKGVSGNVERAVEALVRLGEGDQPPPAPPKEKTLRATRSLTPMTPNSVGLAGGLSVVKRSETDRPTTSSTTSTNPFDMLNRAQPQTAHSTGSLQNTNAYTAPTNPYGFLSAQASPIDQAFQNLTISRQQTGASSNGTGFSVPMPPLPQTYGHSAPASPQPQHGFGLSSNASLPVHAQQQSSLQPQQTGYNPYFSQPGHAMPQHQYQPQFSAQNGMTLNINQMGGQMASNPFLRSPTRVASPPPLGQISETATFSTSPLPLASPGTNPFFAAQSTTTQRITTATWNQSICGQHAAGSRSDGSRCDGRIQDWAANQPRKHESGARHGVD
ncbi:UBA domain-containing protein 3 [Beauveria bassiana]|uniref:UBA domain-containing protein 3 n=1 Tax=Beauveria bassiana TaxID=176275 RepID=A0A2N6NJ99_BEABA|nr:UBA domain-containing protein 3 [Beauveria bassiana]